MRSRFIVLRSFFLENFEVKVCTQLVLETGYPDSDPYPTPTLGSQSDRMESRPSNPDRILFGTGL